MPANFMENILASSIVFLVFLAVIGVIFSIVSYRRMSKQKDYYKDVHTELAPGKKVAFASGLIGKLVRVGKETCDIEVKSGAVIEVSRYAVQEILDK